MSDYYTYIRKKLEDLVQNNQLRTLPALTEIKDQYIVKDGMKLLNLSSNDYLGLASNDALRKQFRKWIGNNPELFRLGASSSRLMTGNFPIFEMFEHFLSQLYGKSALLFNSGYHANVGVISALARNDMVIFADKLVHASIIDGIILSRAPFYRFKHNDANHLEFLLKKHREQKKFALIITESIFSMDGDFAVLPEIAELKRQYNCLLLVDEAHALGIYGDQGLGKSEELRLLQETDILICPLGKAPASMGAFVIADESVKKYLLNSARSLIYSTGLSPLQVSWSYFVMKFLVRHREIAAQLIHRIDKIRELIHSSGLNTISVESQIIPVIVGDNEKTLKITDNLMKQGYFVWPIRPPTVSRGTSRLRISLNAMIEEADLNRFIEKLGQSYNEIQMD